MFSSDHYFMEVQGKKGQVSKSNTEAEYWASSFAVYEIIWLNGLVHELTITIPIPIPLYVDNTSVQISFNMVYHGQTKHIEVGFHFIR